MSTRRKDLSSSEEDVFIPDTRRKRKMPDKSGSSDDSGDEKLSAYEKLRLQNIKMREKLASALGIDSAVQDLLMVTPQRKQPKKSLPTPAKKRIKISTPLPRREPSRRLRHLAALRENTSNVELNDELEEGEEEKDERLLDSKPMSTELKESEDLFKRLAEIKTEIKRDPDVNLRTCDIKEFQGALSSFNLTHEGRTFSSRIQSLQIHPTTSKKLVIAGSAKGDVGLWDMESGQVAAFDTHRAPVNCISVSISDSTKIFTTSHDGTFICGDLEMAVFSNVYATDFSESIRHLTWHDQLDANRILLTHGNGCVGLLDLREPKVVKEWFPCFDRSSRTVQHHPTNDNYFLVSSGYGSSCNVYDLRMCTSSEAVPVSEMLHKKGLTSAFFSSSGDQVLTTCNDDHLRIYTSPLDPTPILKMSIPHNNHTGRWLSVFKAAWCPGRDDAFIIGSLLFPRRIQVYGVNGTLLNELKDPEMTTITPVIATHPTLPFIAGGNSSGKIYAFSNEQC